jgi:hypothetical protein
MIAPDKLWWLRTAGMHKSRAPGYRGDRNLYSCAKICGSSVGNRVSSSVVGWGIALQAGRSRVRFPMEYLRFFIDYRPYYGPGFDSVCNRNGYQESTVGGKCGRCVRLTTLPTSCVDCLKILAAWTSRNPWGLCRNVQGWIYLYLYLSMRFYFTLVAPRILRWFLDF